MRYAIVIEKAESNYSAYVPDLPGCVATGASLEEARPRSARPSSSISKACAKTVCRCRLLSLRRSYGMTSAWSGLPQGCRVQFPHRLVPRPRLKRSVKRQTLQTSATL
jgi:HicB_like antitoxin of bacterial toxin-antitoxin system